MSYFLSAVAANVCNFSQLILHRSISSSYHYDYYDENYHKILMCIVLLHIYIYSIFRFSVTEYLLLNSVYHNRLHNYSANTNKI